jgi:hypothetical protein
MFAQRITTTDSACGNKGDGPQVLVFTLDKPCSNLQTVEELKSDTLP